MKLNRCVDWMMVYLDSYTYYDYNDEQISYLISKWKESSTGKSDSIMSEIEMKIRDFDCFFFAYDFFFK